MLKNAFIKMVAAGLRQKNEKSVKINVEGSYWYQMKGISE